MFYMFVCCLLAAPTKLWMCEIAKIPLNNKRRNFKNVCAKCEAKNAKNVCEECSMAMYPYIQWIQSHQTTNNLFTSTSSLPAIQRARPFVATFCGYLLLLAKCVCWYWQAIKSARERGKYTHKFGHYKYAFDIGAPSKGITSCLYITHTPRGRQEPACDVLTMLSTYLICAIQIADGIIQLGIVDRLGNQYIGYTMHTSSQCQAE